MVVGPSLRPVRGEVVLADGKVVADARLALRCGEKVHHTQTNSHGRFFLAGVASRSGCQAWLHHEGARHPRAQWRVELTSNVLRLKSVLRLVVRPSHRLSLRLAGPGAARVDLLLDESLDDTLGLRPWEHGRKLEYLHPRWGRLVFRLTVEKGRLRLNSVESLPKAWRVARSQVVRLATLPPALRRPARVLDRLGLELWRGGKVHRLGKLMGERTVVWMGRCDQLKTALVRDLAGLEASRGLWGLRTVVVLGDRCGAGKRDRMEGPSAAYLGGAEARWAFEAPAATLLVMGADGSVVWRHSAGDEVSAVGLAMTYLRESWPVFTAVERVSVRSSVTVSRATVTRLLDQADGFARRGEPKAASALFDRVVRLSPKHAEARRRRALVKAALGDLCGAMSDVRWWRDAYGDDSADDLLDQVRRTMGR
ncbi:MAG: carboxypeptidase regulatory-like domain-containing protein [Deltaproteobacteria bacterium]|nr:carboxypeptidase regulatory-like domain-containing protein [Deltaproteobacteria bacterium]